MQRPNVGIGIIIQNAKGEILVGKRKGSHSPFYSIPGGHLEMGETFEVGIKKEVLEETGLTIENPVVIGVTNNLRTFESTGIHHVSVNMFTDKFDGIPKVMEPEKCEQWIWVDPKKLPQPHFDASEFGVECFLKKQFYIKNQK
ncbi:MAG: NUDIX hydrolase [Saprospiraceae bacterium]